MSVDPKTNGSKKFGSFASFLWPPNAAQIAHIGRIANMTNAPGGTVNRLRRTKNGYHLNVLTEVENYPKQMNIENALE